MYMGCASFRVVRDTIRYDTTRQDRTGRAFKTTCTACVRNAHTLTRLHRNPAHAGRARPINKEAVHAQ